MISTPVSVPIYTSQTTTGPIKMSVSGQPIIPAYSFGFVFFKEKLMESNLEAEVTRVFYWLWYKEMNWLIYFCYSLNYQNCISHLTRNRHFSFGPTFLCPLWQIYRRVSGKTKSAVVVRWLSQADRKGQLCEYLKNQVVGINKKKQR